MPKTGAYTHTLRSIKGCENAVLHRVNRGFAELSRGKCK